MYNLSVFPLANLCYMYFKNNDRQVKVVNGLHVLQTDNIQRQTQNSLALHRVHIHAKEPIPSTDTIVLLYL